MAWSRLTVSLQPTGTVPLAILQCMPAMFSLSSWPRFGGVDLCLASILRKSYYLRKHNYENCKTGWVRILRVINALITSRIDYCNSLLYNTSANNISRLQRMHNAAARLILWGQDMATPLLGKLHWQPVACRIQYKILLLSYKITHRHVPFYLRGLLPSYQPTRFLRSSTSNSLVVPRTRGKAGDAAFPVAAPRLWNVLPHALKCAASINILKKKILKRIFLLVRTLYRQGCWVSRTLGLLSTILV